ncbi:MULTISPECIES: DNA alkylation repair protein [Sphingobacterium]|uniref:DNA alkylation repair protein n=1 Tax=Sphingobacterium populi TaxID=1812824 RepID=A0ABW5U9J8_9SPHI|nr:DNA alkylation repair protein [Sphingobacterium sp. CFCC 11742]
MKQSSQAEKILSQIAKNNTKLGDLRAIAKEVKKDHKLAMELWAAMHVHARHLAILIMDKKQLSEGVVDRLIQDMDENTASERLHLIDWLFANQLAKEKKTITMIENWQNSPSSLKRRTYYYYQTRLRWVGQVPPPNSEALLSTIEKEIQEEVPEVQWMMNFTAGQIGIFEEKYRQRCIELGERTGLYKDEMVAKNCTPSYLPQLITIQVEKEKNRKRK